MTFTELTAVYKNKFSEYDMDQLSYALDDCHSTLRLHKDKPVDDPYIVKLYIEIDAIRDRKMALCRKAEKNFARVLTTL